MERAARGRDPHVLASVGQAFTGVEVRIVDDQGRPLPAGEIGEVAVSGPTVMHGYWRNEAATAAQITDGWLLTGDRGELDASGWLTLRDRSREMVVSGGMNIYPREIEEVLALHPRVAEVAVVGTADPEWGERVVAFVVPRDGSAVPVDELDSLCRSRIAAFKRPREYRFAVELPRNEYGKILKRELRAGLAGPTGGTGHVCDR
jgi:long-chain acyl-CoA synthetase